MDCRTAEGMVSSYIKHDLPLNELEGFLDHVQNCSSCYDELETYFIVHEVTQQLDDDSSDSVLDFKKLLEQDIRKSRSCLLYTSTDVRETADGVLVVSHDDSLLRMCGEDRLISEMTYEEIKQYPIINGRNASQYPDNLIPTLEQYIACCNKYSVTPVIEIKSIRTEEAMNLFMQLLTESQKEMCIRDRNSSEGIFAWINWNYFR